ncbi:Gene transfer agent (GTA) orfg15-like protein [Bosea sp. WAO]|uniref:baseplate multidomain protein megatron n=1 Tax=Bosea sp. WAO TaxID=406341 RepID=UPI00074A247E|nr:glycoside hydrolase/phage tail family protein [Bosea sp. WAO]KUL96105.1 Gene transfer agent (GTA) orfg15-like protein [Bosea sp. WAO]
MATLVLQVAGSVLGGMLGGPVGAVIGRALGAAAGAGFDQSLLGGSGGTRVVEGPRLTEIEGLASTEGASIPRVYGRARIGGQLIWATRFDEDVTTTVTRSKRGGKGGQKAQKTYETTYSYYANIAIGLCEGPIAFVRRIWADGREIDFNAVSLRVHRGFADQLPDPLIAAKEAGAAPGYRGTAYVVFERFPLADYGNRVPQFSFEVVRAVPGLGDMIRAVTLIPGASEFIYQPTPVIREPEAGVTFFENRHQWHSATDVDGAIGHLLALCPQLRRISLVVSWFGDDLRAGSCTVAPRVEIAQKSTAGAEWSVAGLSRAGARLVSRSGGKPAYGGTPSDDSVIALIRRLRDVYGLEVVLYPFVMMDIPADNALPDPHTGEAAQPPYPWRGRMSCSPAPDRPGSPDASPVAAAQIASFLGSARASDFSLAGGRVLCAVPGDWGFRRAVLHAAMLAKAAGGVSGFIIGSELVGLTRVRSAPGAYPMVDGLVALAAEVRALLPAPTQLTYAADWTEYGAHVRDGGLEVRFPLDPLWASPDIDAIGIDYYAPLTDWRDTPGHADIALARGAADVDHLRDRLTSGEGYDWYYASLADRQSQNRQPISDGAFGKPWIFRPKDLPGWWLNSHVERLHGSEVGPTPWQPGSKSIWLTEIGLPAVDKGGNAPNVFPDPKSVDGGYPHFSTRARDDLVQARGLEAILSGFDPALPGFDPTANPIFGPDGRRMVDPANIYVWTWDARPFPAFPELQSVWADGPNYDTGHWINGRLEGATLDRLVRAILADYGLPAPDEIAIDGFLDGYVLDRPLAARQVLEPLAQAFGFDVTMSSGKLSFRGRGAAVARQLSSEDLVLDRDGQPFSLRRAEESELPRELRLAHIDGDNDYRRAAARSRRLAGAARRESAVETAIVTRRAEGQRLADQRLQEVWAGRETLELELSPRRIDLEPGDVVSLEVAGRPRLFRLTRISDGITRKASARAVEPAIYRGAAPVQPGSRPVKVAPRVAGRPDALVLDLPIARGSPSALQHLAAFADPWPGGLAIWRAAEGMPFLLHGLVATPSIMGETLTPLQPGPLWRTDRHASVDVRLRGGSLSSITAEAALAGGNAFALIDPVGNVEIVTAARAELLGPQAFRLSQMIRGLGGSEPAAGRILATGARVVVLDGAAEVLSATLDELGRSWRYRVGPANADVAGPAMRELVATVGTAALRPLAPVHPRGRRVPAGVMLRWIRRTRVDGDSWEAAEVPLGEEIERYRVTIYRAGAVKRVIESAAPDLLYPSASEIEDFGATQPSLDIGLDQLSLAAGAGQPWRGLVTIR